ncbi:hypothetical protein [Geodermatophilus obscurus]|uniref:hypothetical protein n=1 Tax=Geodermatophilus obscurus TaxID=1861 RepID=UPI00140FB501|nr:hypothetical protein [Geodermatophilus obscurus]
MPIQNIDVTSLTSLWLTQKQQYDPQAFAVLFCGAATELDQQTWRFVTQNGIMLDHMSGPYTSFTILGWHLDNAVRAPLEGGDSPRELRYLHAASSWTLDADGVYGFANALGLPLDRFPLVLVSLDPWSRQDSLLISLRDLNLGDNAHVVDDDTLARFFSALLSACRMNSEGDWKSRLKAIDRYLDEYIVDRGEGRLKRLSESGVLAQVIEGILKGLGLG